MNEYKPIYLSVMGIFLLFEKWSCKDIKQTNEINLNPITWKIVIVA